MTEKEISEIRRRWKADHCNVTRVLGCYVNEKREIISEFNQSTAMLSETESDELLSVLRKTLSGTVNKNLMDITFETQQVISSPEHGLLMKLRDSQLQNEEALHTLYSKIIESITVEGNYLIVLACDSYDVPYRAKDDALQRDASEEVYTYMLCSICPMKLRKNALTYHTNENAFANLSADWIVTAPEAGFLFPSFDDRSANIYHALYYTRNPAENHPELVDALFHREILMPATAQKETFQSLLSETLSEDCSMEVVQTVRNRLCEMIACHKESKVPEPLVMSKSAVSRILDSCGVPEERTEQFEEAYDNEFGADTQLSPRNIVNTKKMEVRTPDVVIQINSDRSDLIETRTIDGVRYLLIRADDAVEVDGVNIHIS